MIYYTPKGVAIIWPEWSKDDLLAMGQVVPRLEPRRNIKGKRKVIIKTFKVTKKIIRVNTGISGSGYADR